MWSLFASLGAKRLPPKPIPAKYSIIGSDCTVSGRMFSPGMVEMHGRIVGNMDCARTKIGPTGTVSGDLKSDAVTIHGTVIGGIDANRVDIDSTGVVRGDISHADISVHQHAVFEGRLIRTPQADGGTTA